MTVATNLAQDLLDDNKQSILTIVQPDKFRDPYDDSEDDELDMFIFSQLKRSAANKRKLQAEDKSPVIKKKNNSPSKVERNEDNAQPQSVIKDVKFIIYLQKSVGSTFSNHFKITKNTFEVIGLMVLKEILILNVLNYRFFFK